VCCDVFLSLSYSIIMFYVYYLYYLLLLLLLPFLACAVCLWRINVHMCSLMANIWCGVVETFLFYCVFTLLAEVFHHISVQNKLANI